MKHTAEFRTQVLAPILAGEKTQAQQCTEHNLASGIVSRWVSEAKGRVPKKRRVRRPDITEEMKAAAVAELEAGGKSKDIAKRLGVSPAAVHWWKNKKRPGSYAAPKVKRTPTTALVKAAKPNGRALPILVEGVDVKHASHDATLFLRRAKLELFGGIRAGRIGDLDQAHLLALMALNALQGS